MRGVKRGVDGRGERGVGKRYSKRGEVEAGMSR